MNLPLPRSGILSLVLWLILSTACSTGDRAAAISDRVLFDFEYDAELDRLHWQCGTFMARDPAHATSGQYSLRVEMYPNAEYPGFKAGFDEGWQGYKRLTADLYNPGGEELEIAYRIDDREDSPSYADRTNGRFTLRPGWNHFSLELQGLKTSGTNRKLELKKISSLLFFVSQPSRPLVFYLDRIRLENFCLTKSADVGNKR